MLHRVCCGTTGRLSTFLGETPQLVAKELLSGKKNGGECKVERSGRRQSKRKQTKRVRGNRPGVCWWMGGEVGGGRKRVDRARQAISTRGYTVVKLLLITVLRRSCLMATERQVEYT